THLFHLLTAMPQRCFQQFTIFSSRKQYHFPACAKFLFFLIYSRLKETSWPGILFRTVRILLQLIVAISRSMEGIRDTNVLYKVVPVGIMNTGKD
ncbi:MAG: hypothetical protein II242_05680, partial [Peptococcaceae bacterium]|nr:hypothetical protein [Peptococcaceae bacterium]